jgi:hypothetical protein
MLRKTSPALFAALWIPVSPVTAAEQVVTLGDSLTYAYEAEFGFRITIPFVGSFGDGFGPQVRNWVEILNDPAYRKDRFDLGARDTIRVVLSRILFRHEYNWALPGLKIDELRAYMAGQITIDDLVAADPELSLFLAFSDFNGATDFPLGGLEEQIRSSAERLVFFIGGNDVRAVYGTIYNGGSAGSFVDDFIDDAAAILDRVLGLNPNLQIVVVNVPHIGITPDIKSSSPTDPVKTERVTAMLRDLNGRLAGLARARGLGYADIFTPTLSLLGPAPLCIHGIPFLNDGSATGNLNYVWLNGPYSANFHPNTNAQALVANEIIEAFNARYQTGIAPLSATEILAGLHGKSSGEIDMPFATWMSGFGLGGLSAADDSDGDGIPAAVEFATGLNPTLHDSRRISSRRVDAGGAALELSYPVRLPVSPRYALAPTWSPDLATPFEAFSVPPATGADGLARTVLPVAAGRGFLRLESRVTP